MWLKEKNFYKDVLKTNSSFTVHNPSEISLWWNYLTSYTVVQLLNVLSKNNGNSNNQETIHHDFLRKVQLFVSKMLIYVMNGFGMTFAGKCSPDYLIQL